MGLRRSYSWSWILAGRCTLSWAEWTQTELGSAKVQKEKLVQKLRELRTEHPALKVLAFVLDAQDWVPPLVDAIAGPATALKARKSCWEDAWAKHAEACCALAEHESARPCFSTVSAGNFFSHEHCCNEDGTPRHLLRLQLELSGRSGAAALQSHVAQRGLFDFVVAFSVVQRLEQPSVLLDLLPELAPAGFISVPSKFRELTFYQREELGFRSRGDIRSRWLLTVQKGQLLLLPKLPFVNSDPYFDRLADGSHLVEQLSLAWNTSLNYTTVDTNELGSINALLKAFRSNLANDMFGHSTTWLLSSNNSWPPAEGQERQVRTLRALVASGFRPKSILDVGAEDGDWTRQAHRIFPRSKTFVVEPSSSFRSSLRRLVPPRRRFEGSALGLDGLDLAWPPFDLVRISWQHGFSVQVMKGASTVLAQASFVVIEAVATIDGKAEAPRGDIAEALAEAAKQGFELYSIMHCHELTDWLHEECELLLVRRKLLEDFRPRASPQQASLLSSLPKTTPGPEEEAHHVLQEFMAGEYKGVIFLTYISPRRSSYMDAAMLLSLSLQTHAPQILRIALVEDIPGIDWSETDATLRVPGKAGGWHILFRTAEFQPPNAPKGAHFDGVYGKVNIFAVRHFMTTVGEQYASLLDRVIYLDADAFVRSPRILELADASVLSEKPLAAVVDASARKTSGPPYPMGYYNTGVMVFRPDVATAKAIAGSIHNSYTNDQPSINEAFQGQVAALPTIFNLHGDFVAEGVTSVDEAVVVHFTGSPKPTYADRTHLRKLCRGESYDTTYGLRGGEELYTEYFLIMTSKRVRPWLSPLLRDELGATVCS